MMAIRLLTSATLGTVIVACFHLYSYLTTTERLSITHVEFAGLNRVNSTEVETALHDLQGQNILLAPLELYEARFWDHPRIARAEFKKILPNKIVCTVTEREPVALVFTNKFFEVDAEGMIMTADDLTERLDLPIISGLDGDEIREGKRCQREGLRHALETLSLCKRYGGEFAEDISELKSGNGGISIVSLREGVVLLLGESDFENRLKKFFVMRSTIAAKEQSATVIDLRFNDQIVLRGSI
jgi:cell division septal protein FtsQ